MELIAGMVLLLVILFGEIHLYRKYGTDGISYCCKFSDAEVTEGETIEFSETVVNEKILPVPWMKAELTTSKWLDYPESHSTITGETRLVTGFFSIRGRARVQRVWQVSCKKRGIYRIEHVVLVTSDLLGAVRLSLPAADTGGSVLVLPRRFSEAGFLLPHFFQKQWGEQSVRNSLQTDPCLSVSIRDYIPGDPPNRIHWKASAHMGSLLVRQEECLAQRTVTVLLNLQTHSSDSGNMTQDVDLQEHTIRVCAQCLWELCQNGWMVRLCVNETSSEKALLETPFGGGSRMYHRFLEFMAALELKQLLPVQRLLYHNAHQKSEVLLLISPYTDRQIADWKRQTDSFILITGHAHDTMHCADQIVPQS